MGDVEVNVTQIEREVANYLRPALIWMATAGIAALGILFLTLDGRIRDAEQAVTVQMFQIVRDTGDLKVELRITNARLDELLREMRNDQSQTGQRAEPARAIREGARGREGR